MKVKYVQLESEAFLTDLDYAKEASLGRNPVAVFISLLKKEINYNPIAIKAGQL